MNGITSMSSTALNVDDSVIKALAIALLKGFDTQSEFVAINVHAKGFFQMLRS